MSGQAMSGPGARAALRTRWRVWRATPRRPARALLWEPEPRGTGSTGRGMRILAGQWHFAGALVETGGSPWDIAPPSTPFEMQLHGQGWLDDVMATVGGSAGSAGLVGSAARGWVLDWARRFGTGRGRGWDPALTGRRILRWIGHAPALMDGMEPEERMLFLDRLDAQAFYLRACWHEAPAGLPRMEALVGLLHAGMVLEGREALAGDAARALTDAVATDVDETGAIAARNPEALLETALLLGWAIDALAAADAVPDPLRQARTRIAATLRALRHADGGLARFHGGGRGMPGRLAHVLGRSGGTAPDGLAMGFAHLMRGETTLVADASAPPEGAPSGSAHASTLAFELTDGPAPVIVNCGPGGAFGPEWHRAGRATASHSTLQVDGVSSSRIGPVTPQGGRSIAPLVQVPRRVRCQQSVTGEGATLLLAHDGYVPGHGVTHLRRLVLSADGRLLSGEDSLRATTGADRARLDIARAEAGGEGLPFHLRFHLHPDARAEVDMGGRAVSVALPSGAIWVFRPGHVAAMTLEASVHLEPGRLKPRPAQQVVLSDRLVAYAATVDWTLTRAQGPTEGDTNAGG